jgi:hypothetical protein
LFFYRPYKYLWNVLRGESIVADDEVIHEELRTSYERIILALTQFPYFEGDSTTNNETTTAKDSTTSNNTTVPSAEDPSNANPPADGTATSSSTGKNEEKSFTENEKKLRKRIAAHLVLLI